MLWTGASADHLQRLGDSKGINIAPQICRTYHFHVPLKIRNGEQTTQERLFNRRDLLELVVDEDPLHVEPHGPALGREHVARELEGHGGGDEDQGAELDLTCLDQEWMGEPSENHLSKQMQHGDVNGFKHHMFPCPIKRRVKQLLTGRLPDLLSINVLRRQLRR